MKTTERGRLRAPPPPTAGGTTMTAIVQDRYGSAPEDLFRLAEIDRPAIGDGEVLVRVHAASVDRGTWHIMSGLPYPIRLAGFGLRRPKYANPGRNLAGTVEAVGAGVTGFAPGDEVFGMSTSTFAEYATARPDKLAPKPANLSFEQAAAVPVSGGTALQAVRDHGRVQAGEKVLIIGASGGVGSFAVQIAKAFGAEVTGVCSTAKVDMVRALGADHVIDYTREDFADGGRRYDVILDIGGNARLSRLRRALTPRGRLVIVGGETDGRLLGGSRPPDPGPAAVPVRRPEAGHLRRVGERRRPDRPPRPHRGRQAHPGDRPDLPARRGRRRPSATCWTGRPAASSSSPSHPAASRAQTRGAPRDREPNPLSRPRRRVAGPVDLPLAVAGQVAAADPALRRAVLPLAGVLRRQRRSRSSRSCSPGAIRGRCSTSTSACCAGPGG